MAATAAITMLLLSQASVGKDPEGLIREVHSTQGAYHPAPQQTSSGAAHFPAEDSLIQLMIDVYGMGSSAGAPQETTETLQTDISAKPLSESVAVRETDLSQPKPAEHGLLAKNDAGIENLVRDLGNLDPTEEQESLLAPQSDKVVNLLQLQKEETALKPAPSASESHGDSDGECTGLLAADRDALARLSSLNGETLGIMVLGVGILLVGTLRLIALRRSRHEMHMIAPSLQQVETALTVALGCTTSALPLFVSSSYSIQFRVLLWLELCCRATLIAAQTLRSCSLRFQAIRYRMCIDLAQRIDMAQKQSEEDLASPKMRDPTRHELVKVAMVGAILASATLLLHTLLPTCYGVAAAPTVVAPLLAVQAVVCLIQALVCITQRTQEAFGLQRELVLLTLINLISLIASAVYVCILPDHSPIVSWLAVAHYATPVSAWLVLCVSSVSLFLRRMKVPAGQLSAFDDMFMSRSLHQAFEQYLHLEFSAELMMFWQDVDRYKEQFSDPETPTNEAVAQNALRKDMVRKAKMGIMARNIFNKYIRTGAMLDIQALGILRSEIQHRVTSNSISLGMFDSAQDHVYERMRLCYSRYCKQATFADRDLASVKGAYAELTSGEQSCQPKLGA